MGYITNAMLALLISIFLVWWAFLNSKVPLYKILGGTMLILIGLSGVFIEDTIPMYILLATTIITGGWKIINGVVSVANK